MFNKVIVGDNGAAGGRDAIALARALAPEAELVLAGVYPYDERRSRSSVAGYGEMLRQDTLAMLERTRTAGGVPAARLRAVADVSPAWGLSTCATHEAADLVVVGASHRGRVGRNLLGDVGRAVLHAAPCPVAVAPHGYRGTTPGVAGVAYDSSPEAAHALDLAARWARAHGARLVVRHVVLPDLGFDGYNLPSADDVYEEIRRDAEEHLRHETSSLGVAVDARAVIGTTATQLDRLADQVELMVCGSRSWGPVRRVTLGSTADRLIHHASCPVLVAPRTAVATHEPVVVAEDEAQRPAGATA